MGAYFRGGTTLLCLHFPEGVPVCTIRGGWPVPPGLREVAQVSRTEARPVPRRT